MPDDVAVLSCRLAALIALGVSTLLYLPHAVFCYAGPALSVLYGFTGFRIEKTDPIALEEKA